MKNGTPSKALTLVDSAGHPIAEGGETYDSEAAYLQTPIGDDGGTPGNKALPSSTALIYIAVSLACAIAAAAAGSYAIWLTRQKVAHETLNNVQDILKVCQDRMHQLEDDLHLLPTGLSPSA
jgi:hypothetical protein